MSTSIQTEASEYQYPIQFKQIILNNFRRVAINYSFIKLKLLPISQTLELTSQINNETTKTPSFRVVNINSI